MGFRILIISCIALFHFQGCKSNDQPKKARTIEQGQTNHGGLLLAMAQFEEVPGPNGRMIPKPGPAKLTILQSEGRSFSSTVLEDPDSRVFHKAICYNDPKGRTGLLTIGASQAFLKFWQKNAQGTWQAESWWNPTFGGKWDRLRDFEVANVDNDPQKEIIVATHDQGVIAVLNYDNQWKALEVNKQENTFVHEIEVGDVNHNGINEFFATPSKPNKVGVSQAGGVMWFEYDKSKKSYNKGWVITFPKRHAKEILVTDIDDNNKPELYISLEAEIDRTSRSIVKPLEIIQVVYQNGWQQKSIATLPGGIQARVLLAADITGDRKKNLVVTTMKGGIWMLTPQPGLSPWKKTQIDSQSSGFEHAAGLADMNRDGQLELYVTADDQDQFNRYIYKNNKFQKDVMSTLQPRDLTWNISYCPTL